MQTKEITLCCNCGFDRDIVQTQMDLLEPLNSRFKVHWNNRIDRHPETNPSFSQMINHSVTTSPTEVVIWMNDRITPTPEDVIHLVELLDSGFALASKYSTAFMAVTKELFKHIGWFDERFYGGGYEDDDLILRMRLANLAYYESQEAEYLEARILNIPEKITKLSPADGAGCSKSLPHFNAKWQQRPDSITKILKEEYYPHYDEAVGPLNPEMRKKWKTWQESELGVACRYPLAGESRTKWFCYLNSANGAPIKENGAWKEYRPVYRGCHECDRI